MASLQSDSLDDLLFDMYKRQVLKHLKSKMPAEMWCTLATLKGGGGSTSDFGFSMSRLEGFLASVVAGKDADTFPVSDSYICSLKARLECMFGYVLSKEVILGIVDLVASTSSKTPAILEENEKLVVDLLNFLVGSSCIKMNVSEYITPPLKRKDAIGTSPVPPAKRVAKKGNPIQEPRNVYAKVLFPEVLCPDVEIIHDVDSPSKLTKEPRKVESGVVLLNEVSLNNRLNKLCNTSDALYNKNNAMRNKVNVQAATAMRNEDSSSMSFVSGYGVNVDGVGVPTPDSARFPITSRDKMVYNAVCSLAKGKHANCTVVDIGGCILKYFSLGESMAAGNEVCTYVINALCRKYFLDERPSVSGKHFFFSSIAEVFMSECPNYSSVQNCFKGAGSVLPLPLSDMVIFKGVVVLFMSLC